MSFFFFSIHRLAIHVFDIEYKKIKTHEVNIKYFKQWMRCLLITNL